MVLDALIGQPSVATFMLAPSFVFFCRDNMVFTIVSNIVVYGGFESEAVNNGKVLENDLS